MLFSLILSKKNTTIGKKEEDEKTANDRHPMRGDPMKNSITPAQISQNNLKLIYQYIYANGPVSQQDIAYSLRLSRTTVTTKLIYTIFCGIIVPRIRSRLISVVEI